MLAPGLRGRVCNPSFWDGIVLGWLEARNPSLDIWSAASVRTTPVVNLAPHVRSHPDLGVQCGVEVA